MLPSGNWNIGGLTAKIKLTATGNKIPRLDHFSRDPQIYKTVYLKPVSDKSFLNQMHFVHFIVRVSKLLRTESLVQITFAKVAGQSLSRMMSHKHFDKDNNNIAMSDNTPEVNPEVNSRDLSFLFPRRNRCEAHCW